MIVLKPKRKTKRIVPVEPTGSKNDQAAVNKERALLAQQLAGFLGVDPAVTLPTTSATLPTIAPAAPLATGGPTSGQFGVHFAPPVAAPSYTYGRGAKPIYGGVLASPTVAPSTQSMGVAAAGAATTANRGVSSRASTKPLPSVPIPGGANPRGGPVPTARGEIRQGAGMAPYVQSEKILGTMASDLAASLGYPPDAFNNASPAELVAAISAMQQQGNQDGSGGSGSSAARAAAAQQAAKEQAIQQYLGELDKNRLAQQGALDQQYGAINAGYDAAGTQLGSLNQQAADRQAGIMSDLGAQAATSRTNTAAAFQAGDKRLADLQAQYATQQAAQQVGSDRLTGAFGAPQAYGGGSAANDMFAAGRAQNTMMGTGADTMFADRGNVYNALGADASTARGNQFDVLMTKLKLQQQQSAAAQAKANADLASQYNDRRLSVYG